LLLSAQNKPIAMSPLADPVVGAIFDNVQNAGLAAASLVGAILIQDGIKIGKVISVTPQRYYKLPNKRGCRVDVVIETNANERIITEVQIYFDPTIFQRNLFAASEIFVSETTEGTTSAEMAKEMPCVIAINILDFNVREDNKELLQPVKPMFTKEPVKVAFKQFSIYNVQLPRLEEMPADFSDDFYCWLYVMNTAMRKKVSIEEVISMTPELQAFAERNTGFQQYCDQYKRAAADPETQKEYYRWINEQMRQEGMKRGAVEKALKQERAQIARSMLVDNIPIGTIAKYTHLSEEEIKALSYAQN
jgi:predicted transposase/invertase (TIGR01784 family)